MHPFSFTACVEVTGFEPATFCLQSRHSTAELYPHDGSFAGRFYVHSHERAYRTLGLTSISTGSLHHQLFMDPIRGS